MVSEQALQGLAKQAGTTLAPIKPLIAPTQKSWADKLRETPTHAEPYTGSAGQTVVPGGLTNPAAYGETGQRVVDTFAAGKQKIQDIATQSTNQKITKRESALQTTGAVADTVLGTVFSLPVLHQFAEGIEKLDKKAKGFTKQVADMVYNALPEDFKASRKLAPQDIPSPEERKRVDDNTKAVLSLVNLGMTAYGGAEGLSKVRAKLPEVIETIKKNREASGIQKEEIGMGEAALEKPDVVGQITQAKPENIPAATRALSNIETKGVKTFEELSSKFDTKIKENTKTVDDAFGKDNTAYTPDKLTKEFKSGETSISHNFVDDAFSHLKELYTKTNEPAALAKIKSLESKYTNKGLTAKEINNLAREYGSEFESKAFGKNGELKTSVNSGAAENTRVGVKETARELMPDENTRATDKQTTDMIKTKKMVDTMNKKAKMLEQKLQKAGKLQKLGLVIGKGVDVLSGGLIKGFLKSITGIGKEAGKIMDPLQLQKNLEANLKLLDELEAMTPEAAIAELKKQK